MRFLVVSDMHGNWSAFETVLAAHPPEEYDKVLVLGDLVGYGARPNEIVEAVRGLPKSAAVIRGNHDKVASGIESDEGFNPAARLAALWTSQNLTAENLAYVRGLPQGPVEPVEGITICHGTPHDEDAYVLSMEEALECFRSSDSRFILFGHTHVTCSFVLDAEEIEMRWGMKDGDVVKLDPGKRYLINPGSVGQPRDGDPMASCLTLDTERLEATWHRLDYPIEVAQKRILDADLPYFLAERLESGV
jgi:predicted phosphodiesterase